MRQCRICPRECGVDRSNGMTGFCRMDWRIKIARAALHFWEEPCISGERGSGAVFFSGCNLRCVFCQNYKISAQLVGKYITEDELCNIFLDLQAQGAHNINLVTAAHFVPQVVLALTKAKSQGLTVPIIYNSSGYELVSTLKMLEGLIDVYLPDFKYFDNSIAQRYSFAENYREIAQAAISEMVRQTGITKFDADGIIQSGVIVRHLMLPGHLFDSKKVVDYLYSTYGNKIWISIMNQYTPVEQVKQIPDLNRPLKTEQYEALIRYAVNSGIENAYIQEGGTVSESFIPDFYESF